MNEEQLKLQHIKDAKKALKDLETMKPNIEGCSLSWKSIVESRKKHIQSFLQYLEAWYIQVVKMENTLNVQFNMETCQNVLVIAIRWSELDRDELRAIIATAVAENIISKGTMTDKQGRPLTFYYFSNA